MGRAFFFFLRSEGGKCVYPQAAVLCHTVVFEDPVSIASVKQQRCPDFAFTKTVADPGTILYLSSHS